jgi:hypothetical protein
MVFALSQISMPLIGQQAPAAAVTTAQQPAAAAGQAPAQTGGTIRGSVADPDNAEIPGAVVTLAPTSGKPITAKSGSDGNYVVRGVPAGTYTLTVTMDGFATVVRPGVKIVAGTPVTLNV